MINNLNDSEEDATTLANLLQDIPCRIDLIPANDSGQEAFKSSAQTRIKTFLDILEKGNIKASVRGAVGGDINATSGQLRAEKV